MFSNKSKIQIKKKNSGKFIVVEGLEGSGKSNAILQIKKILKKNGINNIIITREPGSTPISESIRLLLKKEISGELITKYTELLMFYAARVQLVETIIKPKLKLGYWIIGDRHDLSTQAYQGGGRKINKKFLKILRSELLGNFSPNLTLYLDIAPKIGIKRAKKRGDLDRIEKESLFFLNKVRKRYQQLVKKDKKIIFINANQSIYKVNILINNYIIDWLQS